MRSLASPSPAPRLDAHMGRVAALMSGGLTLTGATAAVLAATPALYVPLFSTGLKWPAILAPLVFLIPALRREGQPEALSAALFWAFSLAMGLSLASAFLLFAGASAARAFFVAAGMFAASAVYALAAGRDLTRAGDALAMALSGAACAACAEAVAPSPGNFFFVSLAGVGLFAGLTCWEARSLREDRAEAHGEDFTLRPPIADAFALYLRFIILFLLLLGLTGRQEE